MKIIGLNSYDKILRGRFKASKQMLSEHNYPFSETRMFTAIQYSIVSTIIKKEIPSGATLITVPSSSGNNTIPLHFASFISEDVGSANIISGNSIAIPLFLQEAKNNLGFIKRAENPIVFSFNDALKSFNIKSPVFIVEDVLSTGESAINFSRAISNRFDVCIEGVAALNINTKQFISDKELLEIADKLKGVSNNKKELLNSVVANFDGYLRPKYNRFFWDFQKNSPEKIFSVMKNNKDNLIKHHVINLKYITQKGELLQSYSKNKDLLI